MVNKKFNQMKHFAFDLDGTIIESSGTIHKSTLAALKHIGRFHDIPKTTLDKTIGWHFEDIFNLLEIDVPNLDEFLDIFLKVYFDYLEESYIYEGMSELLEELHAKGYLVSLITTKAQPQAERLLMEFGIRDKFDYVMGRRKGVSHKPSPEPLLISCQHLDVSPEETVIIGDTEMDIQCGKNAGAKTCCVSYGYRTIEQLQTENPDYIAENSVKLREILFSLM